MSMKIEFIANFNTCFLKVIFLNYQIGLDQCHTTLLLPYS